MARFLTPDEAATLVEDGQTLAICGATALQHPEILSIALEKRYRKTGSPRNLLLFFTAGQGDRKDYGMNHYAHEGLLRRVIGGHLNLCPKLGRMILDNAIEAYNLPQGVLMQLQRDIAAGRVGTITHVGLKTFADPRVEGGRLNARTTENIVEVVTIGGRELLLYKSMPFDVCFLRGTTADEKGNITMENEPMLLETTAMAMATKNSGGKVIVQVERVVKAGTLDARMVKIPHIYVDTVVQVTPEENRLLNDPQQYAAFSGEIKVPASSLPPLPLDERKIVARRAAMELTPGVVVNLGIGMPEGVAMVANEEGLSEAMTLTVEHGPIGGIPAGGLLFGGTTNAECILDTPSQFDFYSGGGLDMAFLGLGEADETGNINVSRMGDRLAGCGGFVDITQNAKRVFFLGTFTTKGLEMDFTGGGLRITREGQLKKFVKQVGQVTFSGEYAQSVNQPVLYITERAVFALRPDGVHLVEVAPGIDIRRDILDQMDFAPKIPQEPKLMDARIFRPEAMGLQRKP